MIRRFSPSSSSAAVLLATSSTLFITNVDYYRNYSSSSSSAATPRPLSEHPPVMVPQLVRAVMKSPRWFALSKAAADVAKGLSEDEYKAALKKIKKKEKRVKQEIDEKIDALLLVSNNSNGDNQEQASSEVRKDGSKMNKMRQRHQRKSQLAQLQQEYDEQQAKIKEQKAKLKKDYLRQKQQITLNKNRSTISSPSQLQQDASSASSSFLPSLSVLDEGDLPRYNVLDCSLGGGSHSEALLEAGAPFTRVAAIDCDAGGVQRRAEIISKKYGKSRFRFYPGYRFSQIETLFGPRSFDTVIIDPGPNFSQLEDSSRGFNFEDPDDYSLFDMRYSTKFKTTALQIVNTSEEADLWSCATEIALLPNPMARHIVRSILRLRPFRGVSEFLDAIHSSRSSTGEVDGLDLWFTLSKQPFVRMNATSRFLYALRAMVNQESNELDEGIRAAAEVLEVDGRLIIFSRLPFEKYIIEDHAEKHPYLLTSFVMKIDQTEAREFSQPMETTMYVLQKTAEPANEIKNLALLNQKTSGKLKTSDTLLMNSDQYLEMTKEKDEQEHLMSLTQTGTSHGFPARKFESHPRPSFKDQRKFKKGQTDPEPVVAVRDEEFVMPKY